MQFFWLAIIFLVSRLFFLTSLPIFNDEAATLYNGRVFFQHPAALFYLIPDGRGPLVAATSGFSQLLPLDPLLSGRLVQIVWALVTFVVTLMVAKKLGYSLWLQKILAALLITCPFLVWYDPLVLPNSFVTATSMIALFVTLSLIAKPTIVKGMLVGLVVAIGWWYFALILLLVPGLLAVVVLSQHVWRDRKKFLVPIVAAVAVFFLLITPILTNPIYRQITATNLKRLLTLTQLVSFPVTMWLHNTMVLFQWYTGYLTPITVGLFLVGTFFMAKERRLWGIALFTILPIFGTIFFMEISSARNQQVVIPPMLLVSVYGLSKIKWKQIVSIMVITISAVISLVSMIFPHALYDLFFYVPAARGDVAQYTMGWPSGYGVREAADWLIGASKKEQLIVFVRVDSGNPEDGIFVYLAHKKIPVHYLPEVDAKIYVDKVIARYPERTLYFVSRGSQLSGLEKQLQQVARFNKPWDSEYVGVYKIVD